VVKRACDICAEQGARELTAEDRAGWRHVATWIRFVCPTCRAFLSRSGERGRRKAAA
jgi:hypothetical protein